ncbi:MAG: DUF3810 domain-containing protein [Clostridia bacterium]|nr:DUF3810 domain-containing protein [Clostridia bacterium]
MPKIQDSKNAAQSEKPKKGFFRRHLFRCVLIGLAVISLGMLLLCRADENFAEFYSTRVASLFRIALGALSSAAPFAVSEILVAAGVIALVVWFVFAIRAIIRRRCSKAVRRFLFAPLVIVLALTILFSATLGPCYYRKSVGELMGLEEKVDADKLFFALDYLIDVINESAPYIDTDETGATLSPMEFSALAEAVKTSYDRFCLDRPYLQPTSFAAKPVLLSEPMTYTHISGIYTFFTGESIVNVNYPDFIVAHTIAHEYSHQRGIAAENECNFLGFAVCLASSEPYLRYCGAANVFSGIANEALKTDRDRYYESVARLDPILGREFSAYGDFFKKYADSPAGEVSSAVNDAYLKANSQPQGVKSYSMFTTLVVNYCCKLTAA